MFRLSVYSENGQGGVEFGSHNCSSDFNQLIGEKKNLYQNGSKKTLAGTKGHQEGRCLDFRLSTENNPQFLEHVVSGNKSLFFRGNT